MCRSSLLRLLGRRDGDELFKYGAVDAPDKAGPLGEDIAKHIKSYSGLVATKARLEAVAKPPISYKRAKSRMI
jgi:hypothetical protein